MNKFLVFLIALGFNFSINAQKRISLEDIYVNQTFRTKSIQSFNFLKDGKHYTSVSDGVVKKYDFATGSEVGDIFDSKAFKDKAGFSGRASSYTFSNDESKLLITSNGESVYRHSSRVNAHVFDVATASFSEIFSKGKIINPMFSPDGQKVGYVFENNLYYTNLKTKEIVQVTDDGKKNEIINGMSDWVYEEEFGFTRAFFWSPASDRIAYIRFDETQVPEFTMQLYNDGMYPVNETFKYPKVGEKNANVSLWVYDILTSKSKKADLGDMTEMYIPRVKWTKDDNKLCVYKLNRHQNELKLYLVDTYKRYTSSVMFEEKNKYYIDMNDDLTFLDDKNHFVWASEIEGFNQLYLYSMDGKLKTKLTTGSYDVTNFYGVDEKSKKIFFQASEKSPLEKHVFSVGLDGKNITNLTPYQGTNNAQFSSTFDYFSNTNSTANKAATYIIYDSNGKQVRNLEENSMFSKVQEEYGVSPVEFFTFTTSEGVKLNGWMIKPKDFDSKRQYPVFMTQYSGPGSQSVTDSWKGNGYWWNQMIAQSGYFVVCVDGRGTGGRGEEFKKMTYLKLGHYETLDQIEAAKYMGSLPYIDKSRIGIFGWSYGGFMSSLCILKGNDVFKAAIAVAPVTNWKWYDSIYTERYMRTSSENEDGYKNNSPVYFANQLKGSYLLVHGMADDNVHFQNTVEMANELIKANKQFDTYFYPNRNHGIYGDNATIHLYTKMTSFIYEKI